MPETHPRISHCGHTAAGDFIAFDIQWEGDLPDSGAVAWSMVVTGPDGTETMRLVHERGAGEAQYVEAAAGRQDVDPDADLDDGEITVRFPANIVGVAVEWPVWTAVISVDGHEVSSCVVPVG
jgi:hypothetical protein